MLSVKKFIRKSPPDIVLFFERLDLMSTSYTQTIAITRISKSSEFRKLMIWGSSPLNSISSTSGDLISLTSAQSTLIAFGDAIFIRELIVGRPID
ncbi:translocase of chloroplast 90 [Pyrus ussuriensis x Pyrus communis]|uniref:Translocase of chloroplast 90 n=1 Tax=Pyrus ussuriensis x Pyrus communis TaxID=2448454 RepID=A0A5N5F415_9ROSA|nr:translocase of chloroplast 90 [Pyrus ussuriensis x Pyrus communis]